MLGLETFVEELLEQAVAVEDAVTGDREVKGGARVEEAGGKASETTVSEGGIGFFFEDEGEVLAVFGEGLARFVDEAEVGEVVEQCASHEELCGEVVLLASLRVGVACFSPTVGDLVDDGCGQALPELHGRRFVDRTA